MKKIKIVKRVCPNCSSKDGGKTIISTEEKPNQLTDEQTIQSWSGFYKEKVLFDHVKCTECGQIFSDEYFDESSLNELYGSMAPNMDEVPVDLIVKTQSGYHKKISDQLMIQGDYFELGADVGYLANEFRKDNRHKKYYIVEPNQDVYSEIKKYFIGEQLELSPSLDLIENIPDQSLSLVVMVHVLDHLLEPKQVLERIYPKLKKGGLIATVTHDQGSLLAKILKTKWPAYCLQHPQLFSKKTIKILFNSAQLNDIKVYKTKNYFKVGFLLAHIAWLFKIKIKCESHVCNLPIGLKLGNILTLGKK